MRALDSLGEPESRAGAHPDRFQIDFELDAEGTTAQDMAFDMPAGFGGNANAVPQCPRARSENGEECPPESQVGVATFSLAGSGKFSLPLYLLEPGPGEPIAFASSPQFEASFRIELRPDLGLTMETIGLPEVAFDAARIELWGVPADHQSGAPIPRLPFLTLPTRCGRLDFRLRLRSREPDAAWVSADAEAEAPLEGCRELAFAPRLSVSLGNPRADSPTGARMEIEMEEDQGPDGLAAGQIEDATILLPEGLTVSPGGAAGRTVCLDRQLGVGNSEPAACPPSSRVGSVEIEAPMLSQPMVGSLYLGEQRPGERFRLFVVAAGQGVVVKLVNPLGVDPGTGRLSAHLAGMPQIPLRRMSMIFDGDAALLATPLACGSYPAQASFLSHGGVAVESSTFATVDSAADGGRCPVTPPFSPSLDVVSSNRLAGRSTSLSLTLHRRGGEQLMRRFAATLPSGTGSGFGTVALCPDSEAAAGACPAASQIGTVSAAVGSGSSALGLDGKAYLAGPYRHGPFSLVLELEAAVGPFRLGGTVVRSAVEIDAGSGNASVVTDPFPALIEGIPIRLRTLELSLTRPGVIRNPTSCTPPTYAVAVEAATGATANLEAKTGLRGCRRLGLKPRISLALSDRSQLHGGGRPGLRIKVRMRPGDTGLRSLRLRMPTALGFRLAGADEICPHRDAVAGLCGPRSRIGGATIHTPLLKGTLAGSVYLVQPTGKGLPDLWVEAGREGLRMSMRMHTSRKDGGFSTSLGGMPDIPLSSLSLGLRGGRHGMLSLQVDPCAAGAAGSLRSPAAVTGQNGRVRRLHLRTAVPCRSRA